MLLTLILLTLPTGLYAALSYPEPRLLTTDIYVVEAPYGGPIASDASIVVTDRDVIVIDAHYTPEAGAALVSAVARLTDKPLRYLIHTHYHKDHMGGNGAFGPDVTVVSHVNSYQLILDLPRRDGRLPDMGVDGKFFLHRNQNSLECYTYGGAHTATDVYIWQPERRVLWVGDTAFLRSLGYMADGYPDSWLEALDHLLEFPAEYIVSGHGPVMSYDDLKEYRDYFAWFLNAVKERIQRGESLAQIKHTLRLPPEYQGWVFSGFLWEGNIERFYKLLAK